MLMLSGKRLPAVFGSMAVALALLIFVVSLSSTAAEGTEGSGQVPAASVRLISATGDRVSFALQTQLAPPRKGAELVVPGLNERMSVPGLPALPYYSTYIVLPPGSFPRLSFEHTQPAVHTDVSLPPAPIETIDTAPMFGDADPPADLPENLADLPGNFTASGPSRPDLDGGQGYAGSTSYYPPSMVEISEPMMLRDVRLARVTIYPIQYDSDKQALSITPEITLVIDFERDLQAGPPRLAPSHGDQHLASIAASVINAEQIQEFRGLPASLDMLGSAATGTALPLGVELYKIGVITEGIHALTYDILSAAGMDVDVVDPSTFEMMYRGEPVATDFLGDSDSNFEPGESLRFYGRVFAGSRLERQFISQNIFWLWAGGQAHPMNEVASVAGQPVTTYLASLTTEPESVYFQGFTASWPENEPDAWYWDRWQLSRTPVTRTFTVTLPSPALVGPPAQFTVELSSRDSHISDQAHEVAVTMNGNPNAAGLSWWGERNFNLYASVPLTDVLDGPNHFQVVASTDGVRADLALNRITVDYRRTLKAIDDQLIFSDHATGARQYLVQGFSQSKQANLLAWDITDPYSPTVIMSSSLVVGGDGPYTITFGQQSPGDASFILTSMDRVLSPATISPYVAQELNPPGGADWIAISYKDFITETMRLAMHRSQATFGGLSTHVVDIDDITNQYGYGLPIPAAIRNYLTHAMSQWPVKPSYIVLVGDTTLDPRHINEEWTDQQYVPTDLVFVDRYNGHIPSDLTFALVSGSDILPDLGVGRIAVESVEQLELTVDKIIHYDETQLLSFGWMENILFVADKEDPSAGDFCLQQQQLASHLPPSLNSEILCLDDYLDQGSLAGEALRADMTDSVRNNGATMLNYRGHGAVANWGGNPVILAGAQVPDLENLNPFVAVSGDCLDGHYAYPPWESLGEQLVSASAPGGAKYGAAAHWGSSGLGVSSDHTAILNAFYNGLFSAGATALGDAVNHAKLLYYQNPWSDPALMYSFNLQGDPAMHLMRPNIELNGEWQRSYTRSAEQVELTLSVQNHGIYPSQVTLLSEPIADFEFLAVSSTVAHSETIAGDSAEITLQFGDELNGSGIPRGGQVVVTVTYAVAPDAVLGPRVAHFVAEAGGLDAWPGNEQVAVKIAVVDESMWLPILRR